VSLPAADPPLYFARPVRVEQAMRVEDVASALERIAAAVDAGLWAAGFIAYEAAPAFDSALAAHAPLPDMPLLWFGLYESPRGGRSPACHAEALREGWDRATVPTEGLQEPPQSLGQSAWRIGPWTPLLSEADYLAAIARIRDHIAAGDTYQVNYTFPLRASFAGDSLAWFDHLLAAQRTAHSAYVDAGRFRVLSLSPELFFALDGDRLTTRPMKGTRPRGRWTEEDRAFAAELRASAKEQAENVMIVDLLRNDMGRISETGSVGVARLFDIERYETVWQMTSTVTSRTTAPLPRIFEALFPCGSVTGAPKIQTTKIIRALEPHPRGVYCGAVGWCAPGRRATFNVAIRTVTVDTRDHTASYHVGGGITWDARAESEYQECLAKAALLHHDRPEFALLETLRWDGEFHLLAEHLDRLAASAEYFGFPFRRDAVLAALYDAVRDAPRPARVRLLVDRSAVPSVETRPLDAPRVLRIGLAATPVDANDVFLYHKTTRRAVYEAARAARSNCDDVILWNGRGELTESTIANLVLDLDGVSWTPPVECGLLPGTMRARLLAEGRIREARFRREDLRGAARVRLLNSVRGWIDVELIPEADCRE